jgi:hypothetical protein
MPTALWSPFMSGFCAMKATVISPGMPAGSRGGSEMRWIVEGRRASHFGRVTIFEDSKYFQLRITFAEDGSARINVFPPDGGSVLRVALWQWSDLF